MIATRAYALDMRILTLFAAALLACSSGTTQSDAGDDAASASDAVSNADGSADTWVSYAQGFFTTYCTSCHDSSDSTGRDFTMQSVVETNKLTIRCGVCATQDSSWSCAASPTAKQFPIGTGPKPSDAERDRIVAWITAGAP